MLKKILLGAFLAFVAIAIAGYLLLFPPYPFPPEIGRNLPAVFTEADLEFQQRLSDRYPLPVKESELLLDLEKQGFETVDIRETGLFKLVEKGGQYDLPDKMVSFEKQAFPCTLVWSVKWWATGDTVTRIDGKFYGICL